jgi:hypothetical protein
VVGVPADLGLATTGHPGVASQKPDRTSQIKLRIVRTGSALHWASHGLGRRARVLTSLRPGDSQGVFFAVASRNARVRRTTGQVAARGSAQRLH